MELGVLSCTPRDGSKIAHRGLPKLKMHRTSRSSRTVCSCSHQTPIPPAAACGKARLAFFTWRDWDSPSSICAMQRHKTTKRMH